MGFTLRIKHAVNEVVEFQKKDGDKTFGKIHKIKTETDSLETNIVYEVSYIFYGNEMVADVDSDTLIEMTH